MGVKKKHGERNKNLSNELLKNALYHDWVITTAFYSAIHFVEDKILPCDINGINCKNINEVRKAYKERGRHSSREKLVFDKLPLNIATKYKWLDDKSRYSRYVSFKVTPAESAKAQQFLNEIHVECYSV